MSVFLEKDKSEWLGEGKHFFIIEDGFPVSDGHLLIISKRPAKDYFELNQDEKFELVDMIDMSKKLIEKNHNPDGYNIGFNCGTAAGQSVMHFHCHVIPRYHGDMENPKGGVRYCIPDKGLY